MTTSISVQARAHGALVSIRTVGQASDASEFKIAPNTTRPFHIDGNHILEVKQLEPVEAAAAENPVPFEGERVPGQAENDALLKNVGDHEDEA